MCKPIANMRLPRLSQPKHSRMRAHLSWIPPSARQAPILRRGRALPLAVRLRRTALGSARRDSYLQRYARCSSGTRRRSSASSGNPTGFPSISTPGRRVGAELFSQGDQSADVQLDSRRLAEGTAQARLHTFNAAGHVPQSDPSPSSTPKRSMNSCSRADRLNNRGAHTEVPFCRAAVRSWAVIMCSRSVSVGARQ